jgi:arylsulfatase A-like enzyme
MTGLAHRGFSLTDPQQHMVNWLKTHGYETALFGAQHEAKDISTLGYEIHKQLDKSLERETWDTNAAYDAKHFLDTRKSNKPFFMSVGFTAPHRPFVPDMGDVDPNYVMPPPCIPDTPETRLDYANYIASVEFADSCAGVVLDALRENGVYGDTIILLTTDHGIAFPGMKCNLYDAGIGVTLVMKVPGIPGGLVNDSLVSHIDVFPTLCDILSLDKPDWLQGNSLLPLLRGQKTEVNDRVFSEVTFHAAAEPMRCVRTKRYKYIKRFYDYMLPVLPNIDAGLSKSSMLLYGLNEIPQPREEFYDLIFDPSEKSNLIEDSRYAADIAEHSKMLFNWMETTGDSLPGGEYPLPDGAWLNPVTDIDPG